MVGQLGGMRFGIITVKLFQGFSDAGMQPYPPGQCQLLGEGFLNQGVSKLLVAHCMGQLLDDPCR